MQKEDLRELNPKFLLVPPQVVMVEMAGLQEYQHSDAIVNQLNQRLLGKSLAAKVENRSKLGVSFLIKHSSCNILFDKV